MIRSRRLLLISATVLIIGGAAAASLVKSSGMLEQRSVSASTGPLAVLATVDSYQITESELAPLMQQGLAREVALDRRITQSVIASRAMEVYGQEAKSLLDANRNTLLYQLYISKRTDAISKNVTEADIKKFYDNNVKDEDFRQVAVKIFLTSDAREAQTMYVDISKAVSTKSKDAPALIAKLSYLQKEGDHFMALQAVPYNLGQVLKKMNAGDVLEPIVVREGILVVFLEGIKNSEKPPISKTRDEIKQLIVQDRLGLEIGELRKKASISLKS